MMVMFMTCCSENYDYNDDDTHGGYAYDYDDGYYYSVNCYYDDRRLCV